MWERKWKGGQKREENPLKACDRKEDFSRYYDYMINDPKM